MIPREILARLDRLPPAALGALLASVAKLCPECGAASTIRTSRPCQRLGGRIAYFTCPGCGHRWKGRVVGPQQTSAEMTTESRTMMEKEPEHETTHNC